MPRPSAPVTGFERETHVSGTFEALEAQVRAPARTSTMATSEVEALLASYLSDEENDEKS
jgi:hypothetical protein